MHINSQQFVRRKVVNSDRQKHQNQSQSYDYGKEREQLLNHVTSALISHQRDEEILQKFRKEADQMKKKKYQSKRQPRVDSPLSKIQQQPVQETQRIITEEVMATPPSVIQEPTRSPEVEVVLRHSNDLVEKYRKILNIKEKELKRKDRKLEHSKLALQKMSLRVKELERQRKLADREEEAEMSKIELTLRQMGTHLTQNKTTVAQQISALKSELKYSDSEEQANSSQLRGKLPNVSEFKSEQSRFKQNRPLQGKPSREQLQGIKRKAQSLKIKTPLKNPSVVYTKLPTEKSQGETTPKRRDHLDSLNKSIIDYHRLRVLSSFDPEPIPY